MLLVPRQFAAGGNDRSCAILRRKILTGAGVRSISSDCATTDICGSDDERSLRTRGRADTQPAGRRFASASLT